MHIKGTKDIPLRVQSQLQGRVRISSVECACSAPIGNWDRVTPGTQYCTLFLATAIFILGVLMLSSVCSLAVRIPLCVCHWSPVQARLARLKGK